MGGITKTVTVGTTVAAILGAMLWQVHAQLTPEMVFWLFMFLLASLGALFLSWGVTNAWKYDRWTEAEWAAELGVKRAIVHFARWSCAGAQSLANVILVLLAWPDIATWPARVKIAALLTAAMWLLMLCYWSPELWRWVFRVVLPRVNRDIRDGRRSVDISPHAPPDYSPDDDDTLDPAPRPPKPPVAP